MQHSFNQEQERQLRSLTGMRYGAFATVLSTLAKLIVTNKITVVKTEESYHIDRVVNHHEN